MRESTVVDFFFFLNFSLLFGILKGFLEVLSLGPLSAFYCLIVMKN